MKNSISRKDFIRVVAAGVAAKMCRPAVAHASSTDSSVRFSPEVATEMAHILATSYSNRQDLETEAPVIHIWNVTATQVERIGSNGVTYGTTSNNMTGPGFEGYCQSKGLTVTTSTTHSPTFSTFTTHLQKAMPAVVSAGITTKDGPVGHAMPVDGYATLVKNNKTIRCLSIFNGWEDTVFFNYDFSNYTRVSACLVNRSWMR